jgi:hypothetical protein
MDETQGTVVTNLMSEVCIVSYEAELFYLRCPYLFVFSEFQIVNMSKLACQLCSPYKQK